MSGKNLTITVIVILILLFGAWILTKSNNVVQAPTTTPTQTTMPSMSSMPSGSSASSQPVSSTSVTIQNFTFSPSTITVKVGDKVTWTNQDSIQHSATADDNSWDTGLLSQGKSGTVTFNKAGTFSYHCSIHPNMHGTVIVQ